MKTVFRIMVMVTGMSAAATAQNVGIGTTSPTGPLTFANTLGNKIVLLGDGNGAHYGMGVQGSLLQFYSDASAANIGFGFGRSVAFNERMRIINSGADGMLLNGRITLRNGSNPLNASEGPGIWLYKANNSGLLGFMGTENNQNVGFYGGAAGWGFTYDAINSRVGIANTNPAVRLDIGGTDGWDLINGEGDMRIGNANHRIKMGIALGGGGVGAAGIMQAGGIGSLKMGAGGKYQMELNGPGNYMSLDGLSGGLRIAGNAGQTGQVLSSNGNGASPQWKYLSDLLPNQTAYLNGGNEINLNDNNPKAGSPIPFTMPANSMLLMWAHVRSFKTCAIGPCHSGFQVQMFMDGNHIGYYSIQGTSFPALNIDEKSVGPRLLSVTPGDHILTFTLTNMFGNPLASFYPQLIFLPN